MKALWTFRLVGGERLMLQIGPSTVEHSGSVSVWSLLLLDVEAAALEGLLVDRGIRVNRWAEGPSPEQAAEREMLMKAQAGEVEYLTLQCPRCFWLDLGASETGLCGLRGWPSEMRKEALLTHEKAREDAFSCPLLNPED